jgi:SAM-dependent methyltransferase
LNPALDEIRRVLKPQGVLVISEPSNDSTLVRLARLIMYKKSDKFEEDDKGFRSKELIKKLAEKGFNVKKVKHFGFLSYVFAGFPDIIGIMKYMPFNKLLTHILILIDRLLSRIPVIKSQSLHIIMIVTRV